MRDADFAQAQITKYRAAQAGDEKELARLDEGWRYFSQAPNRLSMVDVTDQRRAEIVQHIEMLDGFIRLWRRDLSD